MTVTAIKIVCFNVIDLGHLNLIEICFRFQHLLIWYYFEIKYTYRNSKFLCLPTLQADLTHVVFISDFRFHKLKKLCIFICESCPSSSYTFFLSHFARELDVERIIHDFFLSLVRSSIKIWCICPIPFFSHEKKYSRRLSLSHSQVMINNRMTFDTLWKRIRLVRYCLYFMFMFLRKVESCFFFKWYVTRSAHSGNLYVPNSFT